MVKVHEEALMRKLKKRIKQKEKQRAKMIAKESKVMSNDDKMESSQSGVDKEEGKKRKLKDVKAIGTRESN